MIGSARTVAHGRPDPGVDPAAGPVVYRHPGDLLRVGLGAALLGLTFLVARRGELSVFETDVFRLFNDLPALIYEPVWVVMQLGNGLAIPALAGAAAVARRFRMARDMLLAAGTASLLTTLFKTVVGRERPGGLPVGAVLHEGVLTGSGFVSGHSAVAAALVTAAVPYLSRRWRHVAWALALTVALSRIYVGAHLPLDVVGGLLLGWVCGSLVHYVLGVPRWEPSPQHVAVLLSGAGLPVRDLRPADVPAGSSHPFVGTGPEGVPLFIKVLDPDAFERDRLYLRARQLVVGDVKDADALAPLRQQAADEAVAGMAARARGVRAPTVLLARGTARHGLVVQERVAGRPLQDLPCREVDAALLGRVWHQVALLRGARLAHRDLVTSNVLVDDDGEPWLVDFGNSRTGAPDVSLDRDVAELMASLGMRADAELVVSTAIAGVGGDAVTGALTGLEPLALSAATRAELRAAPHRLPDLRRETRRQLGLPDPERARLRPAGRPAWLTVLTAAVCLFAGLAAVAGTAAVLAEVEIGGWRWLGAAVALVATARALSAAAVRSAVDRRLAVGRLYAAELVIDGGGLVHGRTGARVLAGRYLERAGVLPATARHAYDRMRRVGTLGAVGTAAAAVTLALLDGRLTTWQAPGSLLALGTIGTTVFLLVVLGQGLAWRGSSRPSAPAGPAGIREIGAVRVAAAVGWSAAAVVLETAGLVVALHGVGGHVPVLVTAAVYTVLRVAWAALPGAGAPGIAEVALTLSLTALGEPLSVACAGVLLFRLLAFWLPAVLGSLLAARFEQRLFL